jgi:hypothetical protein
MAISQTATLDAGTDENSPDMDDLDADKRRGVRARRESMIVVPQTDDEGVCIGIYDVHSESGEHYMVVLDQPECCDCPDTEYNGAENCKHRRRVALEITENGCPAPGQEIGDYADTLDSRREGLQEEIETLAGMLDPLAA